MKVTDAITGKAVSNAEVLWITEKRMFLDIKRDVKSARTASDGTASLSKKGRSGNHRIVVEHREYQSGAIWFNAKFGTNYLLISPDDLSKVPASLKSMKEKEAAETNRIIMPREKRALSGVPLVIPLYRNHHPRAHSWLRIE